MMRIREVALLGKDQCSFNLQRFVFNKSWLASRSSFRSVSHGSLVERRLLVQWRVELWVVIRWDWQAVGCILLLVHSLQTECCWASQRMNEGVSHSVIVPCLVQFTAWHPVFTIISNRIPGQRVDLVLTTQRNRKLLILLCRLFVFHRSSLLF